MMEMKYLTDQELNRLISETEAGEMQPAPPEMLENILIKLEDQSAENTVSPAESIVSEFRRPDTGSAESRIREFRRYRLRMTAAIAAAVMLVFAVPVCSGRLAPDRPHAFFTDPVPSAETRCSSDEKLCRDSEIIDALDSLHFIYGEDRLNIFK